jgi:glycosyltransferase involved in cell wall biosynthesis
MKHVLEFVQRDEGADLLVVTNMWPDEERPVYGIYIARQVEALRSAGLKTDVLYLRGYRSSLAYPYAAVRFALASLTWRGRYRLVHVNTGEAALAARFLIGPPMVATYWGDDLLGDRGADGSLSTKSNVRAAFVRAHAHLFARTISQSREMHDRFAPRARARNEIFPGLGLDDESFRPIPRDNARRQLGWGPDERVVLFAATKPNSPAKRLWLAEAACKYAAERIGDIRLHVARSVPPDLMPIVMNAADCLIHTSAVEGGPIVIKEALMCNVPVVTTRVGDAAESIEGVEPSAVCESDPEALGQALIKCLVPRTRSNGRERKLRWLSAESTTRHLLDLYERVGFRGPPHTTNAPGLSLAPPL